MKEKTLLRILAINDENGPSLRTNLLKTVMISDGTEHGRTTHMASWLQHVYLLGHEKAPEIDLLFIDIGFSADPYAPTYADKDVNPLGLLHALTFAAMQNRFRAPLIWGYHSGDPGRVKDDGIAIIAFSLLCALERRGEQEDIFVGGEKWRWDAVGSDRAPSLAKMHFSNGIRALTCGSAERIWQDMVKRYRMKLLEYVRLEKIYVSEDELLRLQHHIRSGTPEALRSLAGESLGLQGRQGRGWSRRIDLQSLFADLLIDRCEVWPKEDDEEDDRAFIELAEFVKDLRKYGDGETPNEIYDEVRALTSKANGSKIKILKGISSNKRAMIGSLSIICWWLSRVDAQPAPHDLLADFGYTSQDYRSLRGCLEYMNHESVKEFLIYLGKSDTRLEGLPLKIAQRWWKENSGLQLSEAPKCIRKRVD